MNPHALRSPSAVVADIGGTNARFGWLAGPGERVAHVHTLPVPDFAGRWPSTT